MCWSPLFSLRVHEGENMNEMFLYDGKEMIK